MPIWCRVDGSSVMLGHGYEPKMGLGRNDNRVASLVEFTGNCKRFRLGYEPTRTNVRRERSIG